MEIIVAVSGYASSLAYKTSPGPLPLDLYNFTKYTFSGLPATKCHTVL